MLGARPTKKEFDDVREWQQEEVGGAQRDALLVALAAWGTPAVGQDGATEGSAETLAAAKDDGF